ncbi:MAG: AAA family ATPase [Deltaproteobacteria bacterium]|nr:AAA family ATPase [Deltaproteobacteria bacterium]
MDYFSILNLNKEPFSNSPDPEYFFHSQQHVACLQKLELSLRLRRGLNVVIGDVGTGKTTLCRQLIRRFKDDATIETHLILDPYFTTPHAFLLLVTEMLAAEKPDKNEDDYQLKERIKHLLFQKGVDEKKTTVLIIDEGQKIPEFCLELLREFLNYETNDYKLLQIAIFAQQEFDNVLKQYANFTDRINLYHRLEPMSFSDTRNMIQFRLNQSSAVSQKLALFTYPAMWAIFRATRGYPRKIVNLCHRSMLTMIIQNRTKANWFLVQSCMKRAFEATPKRSWLVATLLVAFIVAGIVLVPRFLPERPAAVVSAPPESYGISTSAKNDPVAQDIAGRKTDNPTHAGQAQAAKTEIAAVITQPAPQPGVPAKIAEPTRVVPQPADSSAEKTFLRQRPKALGQLRVQRKETLGGLIQKVYGIFNPQYLYAVIEMNPHIADPDTIDIGEVIVFPAIPLKIRPQHQKRWWIELKRPEDISAAFSLLRKDYRLAASSRLIPFWDESSGLQFSIISNQYYYDAATAENTINSLSPEERTECRLLSAWGDATVFYANPYLGP